jgi:hypothetical protein
MTEEKDDKKIGSWDMVQTQSKKTEANEALADDPCDL